MGSHEDHGIVAEIRLSPLISRMFLPVAPFYNYLMRAPLFSNLIKWSIGFHVRRSFPKLFRTSLLKWFQARAEKDAGRSVYYLNPKSELKDGGPLRTRIKGEVFLFCDEFSNYNDVELGIKAVLLLNRLGYRVLMGNHRESARTWLSKGLLRKAREIALHNVDYFFPKINPSIPLVGIEPSAILALKDEYPDLLRGEEKERARAVANSALLFEEFLVRQMDAGKVDRSFFTTEEKEVYLHGHCQQKAHLSMNFSIRMLSLPENYRVKLIPSGCCGMAGSFGFEREHYDLSMKIGELVLFPSIRQASQDSIIAASGTSCRHQIHDGTGRQACHPIEILYEALVPKH